MHKNPLKTCRVCFNYGSWFLFDEITCYYFKLISISSIQIFQGDGLPEYLCSMCIYQLEAAFDFQNKIKLSDSKLRDSLVNKESVIIESNSIPNNCSKQKHVYKTEQLYKEVAPLNNLDIIEPVRDIQQTNLEEEINVKESNLALPKCSIKAVNDYDKRDKEHVEIQNETETAKIVKKKRRIGRNNSKKHMCDTCGKTFMYQSNLNDHVRVHSGDKPFICNVCGQRFVQAGHLLTHMRIHSGDRPYQCEICPKSFTVSNALKKHIRTHTGERPFMCSVCHKSFVTSYHLSTHFKRHTGEKNFKCSWNDCKLSFVNISEMKRHRVRHEKAKEQEKQRSQLVQNYLSTYNPSVLNNQGISGSAFTKIDIAANNGVSLL